MKSHPLPRSFYKPSARTVAPELLGHFLLRRIGDEICGGVIVETEAYLQNDPACHGYARETARNKAMWGEAGHAYVYMIYGYHYCFNAVCHEQGVAEAVLVRAIEPTFNAELMQKIRTIELKNLTNGPAKLCAAMRIDRALDGVDICSSSSPLFVARNPARSTLIKQRAPLVTSTRVGISRAAEWPLRFYLGGSPFVSRR